MSNRDQIPLFRKKAMDKVASPDQLTDYLRVTSPGTWIILIAVILLLAGLFAWSAMGTLETTADVRITVQEHTAQVFAKGAEELRAGMPLRVAAQEYVIASAGTDEYGRSVAFAEVTLPDGAYDAVVVVDRTRPIDFLLKAGDAA